MAAAASTTVTNEGINLSIPFPSTILIAAVAAVSSIFWLVRISNRNRPRPPPLPPGPPAFPFVGNLLSLDPELHTYFASLAKLYGPILKLQLGRKIGVVITSPTLAREVLKTHDTIFANRDVPVAGSLLTYGGKDLASSPYGDQWRKMRRICIRTLLNAKALDSVHCFRRKAIRDTVERLYRRVGSPVDVGEEMFLSVWNAITAMMWGGSAAAAAAGDAETEFRETVQEIFRCLGVPNLSDFFPGLARFDLQGIEKKMRVLAEKFDVMYEKMINEKRKKSETKDGKDFLELLLEVEDEEDGDSKTPFTITHLKALLMDMVVGGIDTTSSTLVFALAELMSKPEILKKAQQEIETVVGKDNIVEEYHIAKLSYLRFIMKEVLRLHPTVPLLVPHCPSKCCVIGGYTIPKGAWVFINAWAIQRDPCIWEKPLEFHPERFLNCKMDYNGNDFSYLPFGSGVRRCVGVMVVERMFMFLLASLIHSFDWELVQREKLDMSEKFGIVLKMKAPILVIATPRLVDPTLYG